MSVTNAQQANQTTFNNAFVSKTATSGNTATGIINLDNTSDVNSGNTINNTQRYQNEIADSDGTVGTGDSTRKVYSSNNIVANGDNRKVAIGKLDATFDITTGHDHDGLDSKQISAANLSNINNFWADRQTFQVTPGAGVDDDVSTQMTGKTPGGGATTVGVVTTAPYNKCEIRDSSTLTYLESGTGERVYARLTESSSVWTLSYYTNISGVETAYNLPSTNIDVFFVEVFTQATRPTFGADSGYIPSLDLTADIVDATASQPGKISTTSQTFGGIKTFQDGVNIQSWMQRSRLDIASAGSPFAALTYNPFVKLTGTTVSTIRGIASGGDGKSIIFHNGTNQIATFNHEDSGASASDRLKLPASTAILVSPDESVEFIYDSNQARWIQKSGSGSGSGGGAGGLNFISLDSSWQATQLDNFNAETGVGDWLSYDDGAVSLPVDMTGGSPSAITLSQTTTVGEVLDGSASFKLVKTASNAQGEGVSCVGYVPLGYRGQVASIQFPYKIISGSLVDGDLACYVYDVTNSQVLTPVNNSILGASNNFKMTVNIPVTCAQIRVGFHFQSTSTTAVTFTWDDFVIGPREVVFGPTMTDWQSYTPIFTGFGTAANITFNWRQVGANIEIQGRFDTGTVTATEARISLPGNYSVKTGEVLGIRGQAGTSAGTNNDFSVIAEGGQSYLKFAQYNIGATGPVYEPVDGTNFPSSAPTSFFASVPIEGLSTNVVQQNAGMFSISNYLANGTRVTGTAPTKLGEYRSYLRNAGANTYTETSGDPATAPSATDGFILYADGGFAAGSTANNPTRYDIYVGKNKKVYYEFYSSSGRSGNIGVSVYQDSTLLYGYLKTENPDENGIVSIYAPTLGTSTLHVPGIAQGQSPISPIYCDIFISDSVVPVQIGGKSEIYLTSGNGHGSTNTKIRRYSNLIKSFGSAISYIDSAADGASFQINQDGCYCITLTDVSAGGQLMGVSVNSTQLTTNIDSITNADRLINVLTQGSGQFSSVSVTTLLNAGDIIRSHDEGSLNGASDNDSSFRITKIS